MKGKKNRTVVAVVAVKRQQGSMLTSEYMHDPFVTEETAYYL